MKPWQDDKLDRSQVSEAFTNLAKANPNGGVFLIDSGFGTGKTFFANNWQHELSSQGVQVVLFDAWRSDFLDSPLAGFVSALRAHAHKDLEGDIKEQWLNRVSKFAKSAAPVLLKSGVKIGVRALSLGLIEGDVDRLREILASEGLSLTEEALNDFAVSFEKAASQVEYHNLMQTEFQEVVSLLSGHGECPLVVLIDELDRCRPEFAISLLEDIKHFLEVEGVCFFIFCDYEVMLSQASMVFGEKKSGEKYLSKFYDYRLRLPSPSRSDQLKVFFQDVGLGDKNLELATELLADTTRHYEGTIRDVQKIAKYLSLTFSVFPHVEKVWPIYCVLAVVRHFDWDAYRGIGADQPLPLDRFPYGLDHLEPSMLHKHHLLKAVEMILCLPSSVRLENVLDDRDDDQAGVIAYRLLNDLNNSAYTDLGVVRERILRDLDFVRSLQ